MPLNLNRIRCCRGRRSNRLVQVDGTSGNCSTATACYFYDAFGRRVQKTVNGIATDFLYDGAGNVVTEFNNDCPSTCWSLGYACLNGQLVAQYSGGTTYFVDKDQVGSSTILTTVSGGPGGCIAFYPYGEQDSSICSSTTTTHDFTGKERDAESSLDNFAARYYSSATGRFMSPDPMNYGADPRNPQSWNGYAYVLNSPLSFIDPSGLYCFDGNGNMIDFTEDDCESKGGGTWIPTLNQSITVNGDTGESTYTSDIWTSDPGNSFISSPQTTGFTLGIRQPGQTYKACMAANANTYSLGGSVELGINVATGTNTSFSSNPLVSAVTGNSINGFLFGSTGDAAGTMATSAPGLVSTAMGTATTFARRTSSIMSLNLAGAGGLPMALSPASAGVKSALGSIGNVLSLGLSFLERTSVDAAFTGAEAINCAIPQ
ncbi:MAG TPA: RHS repeat-associated core domain-containing protein [Candidatus Acidoferrales bacterium]